MGKIKSYDATIIDIERMQNTRDGNPQFLVTFQHEEGVVSAFTKTGDMLAYKIDYISGDSGREVRVEIGTHYGSKTINSIVDR